MQPQKRDPLEAKLHNGGIHAVGASFWTLSQLGKNQAGWGPQVPSLCLKLSEGGRGTWGIIWVVACDILGGVANQIQVLVEHSLHAASRRLPDSLGPGASADVQLNLQIQPSNLQIQFSFCISYLVQPHSADSYLARGYFKCIVFYCIF